MHMKTPIPDWLAKEVAAYDLDITPPPTSILDLGANIGAFCLHYAAKWPAAKISAYEPVPENCRALIGNLKEKFEVGGIAIFQAGVRAAAGSQEIFKGENFVTHSFHQRGRQTSEKIPVVVHAAGTIPSHEMVKIDTEGCEVEILENLDLSRTRAVVVEYHSVKDRQIISAILVEAGFKLLERIKGSAEHGVLKFGKDDGVTSFTAKATASAAPRSVYLAVAGHFANNDVSFVQSLVALVLRTTVKVQIGWSCDPSVERARNILTANFLESDCTHILFVDADIGFSAEDVAQVSSHAEPVVGGLYPLKNLKPVVEWCGNGLAPGEAPVREDGLSPVRYIGTGFLCIKRAVFETLIARGVVEKYKQDFAPHREEFAFWTQGVREGRFLTEDWMFCQRWLELGGKIFADADVVLRHAGRAEWPLPFQAGNPFVKSEIENPKS